jgi:hypothetical protein
MQSKTFVPIAFVLGLLTLTWARVLADPAVPEGFGPWQTAQVGKFMTLRIPGKLKAESLDLDAETKKKNESVENYSLDNANSDDYFCMVTYTTYKKGIVLDLEGGAQGYIGSLQKNSSISNFKFNKKYIHRFKLKGVILNGTFTMNGKDGTFQWISFVKKNRHWAVSVFDITKTRLPEVTKAIFDSIQIKAD